MRWRRAARDWDRLGASNPFGVILTGADRQARQWDADEFFRTGVADVGRVMTDLASIAPNLPRRSALDFGCGVGRITRALAAHFEAVVGLDVAPSMIAEARRLNASLTNCRFRVNKARRIRGCASDAFDFAYSCLVLQHIPPAAAAVYIAELVRVLAPGGVLMFQMPEPVAEDPDLSLMAEAHAFVAAPIADTAIKKIAPRWVVRAYRRVRFQRIVSRRARSPRMHMFGMTRAAVLEVLAAARATPLRVDADRSHGTDVPGYAYWVTKRAREAG